MSLDLQQPKQSIDSYLISPISLEVLPSEPPPPGPSSEPSPPPPGPSPLPPGPSPPPAEPSPPHFERQVSASKIGRTYAAKLFSILKQPKPADEETNEVRYMRAAQLPPSFAIEVPFEPYDQGSIGSCTANAICTAWKLQSLYQSNPPTQIDPSRMFLYYVERSLDGGPVFQEGAVPDDGYKTLMTIGICKESTWPYVIAKSNVRPSQDAYTEAKLHHITSWGSVSQFGSFIENIKQVIVSKTVVVVGIMIYDSFESDEVASSGIVQTPNTSREQFLGGHAIALVGYDDTKQAFLAINSWGSNWGTSHPSNSAFRGFCYLPYDYIGNTLLCDECLFMNGIVVTAPPPPPPPPPPPQPRNPPRRKPQRKPAPKRIPQPKRRLPGKRVGLKHIISITKGKFHTSAVPR